MSLFDCVLNESPRLDIKDDMGQTSLIKALDILTGKRYGNLNSRDFCFISRRRLTTVSSHIQKILKAGAILNQHDLNEAFIVCSKQSDFKGMECLIRHGGVYWKKDIYGTSLLHQCWLHCKYFANVRSTFNKNNSCHYQICSL